MKFINYLETITGIGIYPLISLFIFVIFFTVVTLYAFKLDKKYIGSIQNIPLEKESEENSLIDKTV